MVQRSAWDGDALPELVALEAARAPWLDRLVDLHVLAEHGDTAATETAGLWLNADPEARRVWDEVQHRCDRLRDGGEARATP